MEWLYIVLIFILSIITIDHNLIKFHKRIRQCTSIIQTSLGSSQGFPFRVDEFIKFHEFDENLLVLASNWMGGKYH